jgi:hypothetical protein
MAITITRETASAMMPRIVGSYSTRNILGIGIMIESDRFIDFSSSILFSCFRVFSFIRGTPLAPHFTARSGSAFATEPNHGFPDYPNVP